MKIPTSALKLLSALALVSALPATGLRAAPQSAPRTPESSTTPVLKNENRHAEFLRRIRSGPVDLVFLGDSITDFWNRRGESSWLKFAPYHPANLAVSADRTEHVLWRILHGELDGIQPKVTVVMIGTNNLGQCPDETAEWAARGVKRIIDVVHEKNPTTKVLLLAVFPRSTRTSAIRARVAELNGLLAQFDDGQTTKFLDIGNAFLDPDGEIAPDIMPDKLHPGPRGYDIWYGAMRPTLETMMR